MNRLTTFMVVLVGGGLVAGPATASAAVQPNGGSGFNSTTNGWTSAVASCQPAGGAPGEECSATNSHDALVGNPPGSLRSRLSQGTRFVTFSSDFTWRSPSFTVPGDPGDPVDGSEFTYDRSFNGGGLLTLDPEAEATATLVNEATGDRNELVDERLAAGSFATRTATVPLGGLVAWQPHHIELHASIRTTSTDGVVLGPADVYFDNVRLDVPNPPGNSAGVTFPRPPRSGAEIQALMIGANLNALVGNGPGGSHVPIGECTIVGTPGADRMRGTRANDVMCGLGGNDRITGLRGRDVIDGGDGDDKLRGNGGGDMILGLDGKDLIKGKRGRDKIGGGDDRDRMFGQGNKDLLAARDDGRDLVHGGASRQDRARVDRSPRKGKKTKDRVRKVERVRAK